jgi:hypothetical protein
MALRVVHNKTGDSDEPPDKFAHINSRTQISGAYAASDDAEHDRANKGEGEIGGNDAQLAFEGHGSLSGSLGLLFPWWTHNAAAEDAFLGLPMRNGLEPAAAPARGHHNRVAHSKPTQRG